MFLTGSELTEKSPTFQEKVPGLEGVSWKQSGKQELEERREVNDGRLCLGNRGLLCSPYFKEVIETLKKCLMWRQLWKLVEWSFLWQVSFYQEEKKISKRKSPPWRTIKGENKLTILSPVTSILPLPPSSCHISHGTLLFKLPMEVWVLY